MQALKYKVQNVIPLRTTGGSFSMFKKLPYNLPCNYTLGKPENYACLETSSNKSSPLVLRGDHAAYTK